MRVTGSGLGCPTWPQCFSGSMVPVEHPEYDLLNQWIEFGNRLFTIVVVAVAVATGTSTGWATLEAAWSVLGAVAIGVALGWLVARLLLWAEQHGDVDPSREVLSSLLLALGALGLASLEAGLLAGADPARAVMDSLAAW